MKPISTFTVSPYIPEKLIRLREIAYNLWWSWNADARELFSRLDMDLWEETRHNPVLMLSRVDQETLNARVQDESYLFLFSKVLDKFDHSMSKVPWYNHENKYNHNLNIAYFSMEYGITESLAVYSGGLGILSADHLKSSSELGIPLHAVGLSYQYGYFQQTLNVDDWQEEQYPLNDFYNMPISVVKDKKKKELLVKVAFPGRTVYSRIWLAKVGRVDLYLLDTNIPKNNELDRKITSELYGGDTETRVQQELILGVGGVRALKMVDTPECICHMNEGHSAFSGLERIRNLVSGNGLTFYEALEIIKASSIFTTHTPVEAGIDYFSPELIRKYFSDYCREVKIDIEELLALGRKDPDAPGEFFSMAVLAINLSYKANAVSKLHQKVAQEMWKSLWPEALTQEIPIISVTNGIHHGSWVSQEMSDLFDRYLGPYWQVEPADAALWKKVEKIPDVELWHTHERRRERLVTFARKRLIEQYRNLGKTLSDISRVNSVLNTEALTIGFSRRFATYKRANLIFSDPDRLAKILTNKKYPIQIIVAGKAHPKDEEGKKLIRQILKFSHEEPFYRSITFLENYDMNMARYFVQGCDLWLNNPRRGLEACGTSGMKAAVNGVLNFSTYDGWWDEICQPGIGWSIGKRETYEDLDYWDKQDASTLYNILENEILPTYYDRDSDGLPRRWISMMKSSMKEICPIFNTNRMLIDYTANLYFPAAVRTTLMRENDFAASKELAAWKEKMREHWDSIRFLKIDAGSMDGLSVKSTLNVRAEIYLDVIQPEDVEVQIYYGKLDIHGDIIDGVLLPMSLISRADSNKFIYEGIISNWESGLNGYTIRLIPQHPALGNPFEDGLVHWFED